MLRIFNEKFFYCFKFFSYTMLHSLSLFNIFGIFDLIDIISLLTLKLANKRSNVLVNKYFISRKIQRQDILKALNSKHTSMSFKVFYFPLFPEEMAKGLLTRRSKQKLIPTLRSFPKSYQGLVTYLIVENKFDLFLWFQQRIDNNQWSVQVLNAAIKWRRESFFLFIMQGQIAYNAETFTSALTYGLSWVKSLQQIILKEIEVRSIPVDEFLSFCSYLLSATNPHVEWKKFLSDFSRQIFYQAIRSGYFEIVDVFVKNKYSLLSFSEEDEAVIKILINRNDFKMLVLCLRSRALNCENKIYSVYRFARLAAIENNLGFMQDIAKLHFKSSSSNSRFLIVSLEERYQLCMFALVNNNLDMVKYLFPQKVCFITNDMRNQEMEDELFSFCLKNAKRYECFNYLCYVFAQIKIQ